jgi:hypothetical protein
MSDVTAKPSDESKRLVCEEILNESKEEFASILSKHNSSFALLVNKYYEMTQLTKGYPELLQKFQEDVLKTGFCDPAEIDKILNIFSELSLITTYCQSVSENLVKTAHSLKQSSQKVNVHQKTFTSAALYSVDS